MANVRVEQRNAHLATAVRLESVPTRDGVVSKGTVTAISNGRKGGADGRADEPTAIQWTLWGTMAENAARYLTKGSHVNVAGRLRNDHYVDGKGVPVFGFAFTVEEIDYLDSRAEGEARRSRQDESVDRPAPVAAPAAPGNAGKSGRSGRSAKPTQDDDIPF